MSIVQGEASLRRSFAEPRMEVGHIKINLKAVNGLLVLLSIITLVYYLAGVIDRSGQGFELRDLKSRAASLATDNTQLEARADSLKSMSSLKERVAKLNMVDAQDVVYLGLGAPIAKR
ncbi:MAG: hypothetical protein WCO55_03580 [Candidatus Falkowbacteria bacterium]